MELWANLSALFSQQWLFFAMAVTLAYIVGTVTGFGSNVLALAVITSRYTLSEALPVVVPLSLALSTTILWQNRRQIHKKLLLHHIFPLLLLGFALGSGLFHVLSSDRLQQPFGVFVVFLAAWQLARLGAGSPQAPTYNGRKRKKKDALNQSPGKPVNLSQKSGIFGAGITQGLFASGGPLLVYSLSQQGLAKGQFRATLAVVWTVLNSLMSLGYAGAGMIQGGHLLLTVMLLPFVPIGVFVGNRLHNRINQKHFYAIVYGLLALAGILIFI